MDTVTKKRKKKRKNKATYEDEVQREMDTRSTENLAEGNVIVEKPKINVEVQSVSQTKVDTGPTENLSEGNVTFRNREAQDEVQSMDQTVVDTGPIENYAEGHVTKKRKKKRKNKARNEDELQREMDTRSTENLVEENVTVKKPKIKVEVQSVSQTNVDTGPTENLSEGNVTFRNREVQDEVQSMDQTVIDTGPTENYAEGHVTKIRKKKRKNKEKNDELQREMYTRSTENLAEGNVTVKKPKLKDEVQNGSQTKVDTENVTIRNREVQDEVQTLGQTVMDTEQTENYVEGHVTKKRKKKRKTKEKNEDAVQREMDTRSTEDLAEGSVSVKKPKIKNEVQSVSQTTKVDTGPTKNVSEGNVAIRNRKVQDEVQSMGQTVINTRPTENYAEGHVTKKRKKKRKNKEKIEDEVQREIDTRSTENLAEGYVTVKKPKIKDSVQSISQTKGDTENFAEGNATIKDIKIQDEAQNMDQIRMGTGPTENSAEGNVTGKRKKKRKSKVRIKDEVHSIMDTRSTENLSPGNVIEIPKINDEVQSFENKMDTGLTEILAGGNANIRNPKIQDEAHSMDGTKMNKGPTENSAEGGLTGRSRKKRKRTRKAETKDEVPSKMDTGATNFFAENANTKKPEIEDEVQSVGLIKMDACSTENLFEGNVTFKDQKIQDEAESMDHIKMDAGPNENSAEGNGSGKRKRKRKSKAKIKDEVQSNIDTRTENIAEVNAITEKSNIKDVVQRIGQKEMDTGSIENHAEGNVSIKNPKIEDEAHSMDQSEMDAGPTENFVEEINVTVKSKKKRKRSDKAKTNDEVPNKMDKGLTENLAEANATIKKSEIGDRVDCLGLTQMDTESAENLAIGYVTIKNPKIKDEVQILEKTNPSMGPIGDFSEVNVSGKREKKRKSKKKAKTEGEFTSMELERKPLTCKSQHMSHPHLLDGQKGKSQNGLSEVRNEVILDTGKGYAEGTSAISTCDVKLTSSFSSFIEKDVKDMCPKAAPATSIRRKLLVLDLNGLLADVVFPAPKQCSPDFKFFGRAIFKRPFCDDFLKFCFQNFDVGIWSSRNKKVVDKVVEYLLGDQKDKLLFCWDMQYATQTGFKTLENIHKPLVCKELGKIWENDDPNLPWKKGDYNKSNTLLLDDSPFKALLNPMHTAIFPHPYQYTDKNDDSLGPGGALRVYLEGLAKSENVQKYVEQHPFGQRHITEENSSWDFYSRVLHQMTTPAKGKTPMSDTSKGKTPISNPVEDKTPISNPLNDKTPLPILAVAET